MSIGILKFKLPEEQEDFLHAQRAYSYLRTLTDFDDWLRKLVKYEDRETVTVQEVRDRLREIQLENAD